LNFVDINDTGEVVYTLSHQYDYQSQYFQLFSGPRSSSNAQQNSLTILPYGTFSRPMSTLGRTFTTDPAALVSFIRNVYLPASQDLQEISNEIKLSSYEGLSKGIGIVFQTLTFAVANEIAIA